MSARYDAALAEQAAPLPADPSTLDLVRIATLAASGHNTQPWRFHLHADRVTITPDFGRRTPVVDPDDHHLWASLGCAAETLAVAARARGRSGEIRLAPDDPLTIDVDLTPTGAPAPRDEAALFAAIPKRQSTRCLYDGRPVAVDVVDRMVAAARTCGVDLVFVSHASRLAQLEAMIVAGNTAQVRKPAFVGELLSWLRFSPAQALAHRDGLYGPCAGSPTLPAFIGRRIFPFVFREKSENDKLVRQLRSSAGLAVFVAPVDAPRGWIAAGRAYQRAALQATADGLKLAFVNQTVEEPAQRAELRTLLTLGDRRPSLVLRIGHAPEMPRSLRRRVGDVVVAG